MEATGRVVVRSWVPTTSGTPVPHPSLLCAGKTEVETDQENRNTVRLWRERFNTQGLQALWEIALGRGRKPVYDSTRVKEVIDATLQSKPKGSTQWSCRTMAEAQGMSKSTVNNIWRSHNIKPHRSETFKLSRDPKFLEKLMDVVGSVSESAGQSNRALC